MKLAIVGSRHYTNKEEFNDHMITWTLEYGMPSEVISGGAKGTDTLAFNWALENKIDPTIYHAEWKKYGNSAGPIRNQKIIDDADTMIAFLSPNSKGTKDSIKKAIKKGIHLTIVYLEE